MKTNSLTKMASLRKVSSLTKTLALAGSVAAMAALGTSSAQAQIIANFTGGNDTNNGGTATPAPDTYTGAAGNGWSQAWYPGGNIAGDLTGTVVATSPLLGGGNYLSMTDSAADTSDSTLTRAYGGNGVSPTVNQTITFDYRLDTSLNSASYITVGDALNDAAGVGSSSSPSSFGPMGQPPARRRPTPGRCTMGDATVVVSAPATSSIRPSRL